MTQLVLSLGSNLQREKHIFFALDELTRIFGHLHVSPVYQTSAVGFDGPDFYNLVAVAETSYELQEIIHRIRKIEADAGRERGEKSFQSRNLDIDILLFGNADLHSAGYDIPRKEIEYAAHVIKPLSDVLPDTRHPVTGQSFDDIWRALSHDPTQLAAVEFSHPCYDEH